MPTALNLIWFQSQLEFPEIEDEGSFKVGNFVSIEIFFGKRGNNGRLYLASKKYSGVSLLFPKIQKKVLVWVD